MHVLQQVDGEWIPTSLPLLHQGADQLGTMVALSGDWLMTDYFTYDVNLNRLDRGVVLIYRRVPDAPVDRWELVQTIDPASDLYVVILTNRVHPTRDSEGIQDVRRALHDKISSY